MGQKYEPKQDLTSKEILGNPAFQYMKTIDEISQSFLKNMDLHFFGHVTAYPTGEFSFLCNKHGWAEKIFADEKLPPIGFVFYDQLADGVVFPNMDKSNIFGWSDEVTVNSRDQFNILNPMLIMQKYDDHFEGFVFDIHDKNAYEKYVRNLDVFEKFMHYYKDSAKKNACTCQAATATRRASIFNAQYKYERNFFLIKQWFFCFASSKALLHKTRK